MNLLRQSASRVLVVHSFNTRIYVVSLVWNTEYFVAVTTVKTMFAAQLFVAILDGALLDLACAPLEATFFRAITQVVDLVAEPATKNTCSITCAEQSKFTLE